MVEQGQLRVAGPQLGISHKTGFKLVKTGSVADKPRNGRPRITTKRQDRVLTRISLHNCRLTAPELMAKKEDEHEVQCQHGQFARGCSRQGYGAV